MKLKSRARELVTCAMSFGFVFARKNKHIIMKHPNGATVAISSTPSEPRGHQNKLTEIRRLAR